MFKKYVDYCLPWLEESRPGKLTLGVKFCAETDVQFENVQVLHLNPKFRRKRRKYEDECFNLLFQSPDDSS